MYTYYVYLAVTAGLSSEFRTASGGVTIQRGHNPEGRIQRVALEEDREEGEQ